MSCLEPERLPLKNKLVKRLIEPENEVVLLAEIAWWTEKIQIELLLNRKNVDGDKIHRVTMKSLENLEQDCAKVSSILNSPTPIDIEEDFFMTAFDILLWNCRGAGNANFRRHFTALIQNHKPEIVALMETKVDFSSMDMFFNTLGFPSVSYVDPVGRSGGIWLLWDPNRVTVRINHISNQAIHATISKDAYEEWIFSTLYASPNPRNRDLLWNELESMAENYEDKAWAIAGDMNDIANSDERRGASPITDNNRLRTFAERINKCNLIDVGSSGPKFTWTNGRQGLANIQKRLDRALCNSKWRALFPEVGVKLNTDGCWMESKKMAGYGGLFRDHRGQWLLGYYGKMDGNSGLEAELWGIYRGLTIMLEKGLNNITVESDSLMAVQLIKEGLNEEHPNFALVMDARNLLIRTSSTIDHVFREANQCADCLAHLGAEQLENLVVVDETPQAVRTLVREDALGVGLFRD